MSTNKLTLDDIIYYHQHPRIDVVYKYGNPRPKAFFTGSSKKKCRALIVDKSTNKVIDALHYPTRERIEALFKTLPSNKNLEVRMPHFREIIKWHVNTSKIRMAIEPSSSMPRFTTFQLDDDKNTDDVKLGSSPMFLVCVDNSNKIPEVLAKWVKPKQFNHTYGYHATTQKDINDVLRNKHLMLYGEYESPYKSPDDIKKVFNLIKMLYASESKKMYIYIKDSIERIEEQKKIDFLEFLKLLPVEYLNKY